MMASLARAGRLTRCPWPPRWPVGSAAVTSAAAPVATADSGSGGGGAWRAAAAAGHPLTAGLSGVASSSPPPPPVAAAAASPPPSSAPPSPAAAGDVEAANDIGVLLCLAAATRLAVADAAARGAYTPDQLVAVEATAAAASALARRALGALSPPVELASVMDAWGGGGNDGDGVGVGAGLPPVPPLPSSALPTAALLHAYDLRDDLEEALVQMNVLPPAATAVAGSSSSFGKPTPAARVAAGVAAMDAHAAAAARGDAGGVDSGGVDGRGGGRGAADAETATMASRRAALEAATALPTLLRGYDTALLDTCRVHKVTRGGTAFSIKALVGVGNRAGAVGIGEGKADTAAAATERACRAAVRDLLPLPALTAAGTLPHPVRGVYVRTEVRVWPSRRGAGVAANNVFAALFALGGVSDVGAKVLHGRGVANACKALMRALGGVRGAEEVARTRGLGVAALGGRRR